MTEPTFADLLRPRGRGQRGRTEVWYLTATDSATGLGVWVHHETVAPADGPPYAHGWTAVFDADCPPVVERFGPTGVSADQDAWHRVDDCTIGPLASVTGSAAGRMRGATAGLAWDLELVDPTPPLWTFPRTVWERELLPGAQMLPAPSAQVSGTVTVDGNQLDFNGRGGVARIYGHGSAQRWGWLHADLDEDTTLEIVTATARRPGLRRLPPLALVQLRRPGRPDWPRRALLAAPRFRTRLTEMGFEVTGRAEGMRLTAEVHLPRERSVTLEYEDPDGALSKCTNSEVATAEVTVVDRAGKSSWRVEGRAHAEVGRR